MLQDKIEAMHSKQWIALAYEHVEDLTVAESNSEHPESSNESAPSPFPHCLASFTPHKSGSDKETCSCDSGSCQSLSPTHQVAHQLKTPEALHNIFICHNLELIGHSLILPIVLLSPSHSSHNPVNNPPPNLKRQMRLETGTPTPSLKKKL
jgi:hypothetical protein